ncbi:hypothetical protein CXP39_01400 [Mesoplasma syrphidae]|uniref:Uncharacterized protein n=1 Tax=Mesoplasma syrphidae TaxID=225999 RepID=A0A2K9C8V8_9MOLU|nr:hypothetical protein [Mesoplasma syrphidae]AUF83455.1 hypothetical protein CXP39_01400 [Mesoplasma syrphidae]
MHLEDRTQYEDIWISGQYQNLVLFYDVVATNSNVKHFSVEIKITKYQLTKSTLRVSSKGNTILRNAHYLQGRQTH